jgi:enamine deaminase RidA (YjgF/YER057c/UK114 family)
MTSLDDSAPSHEPSTSRRDFVTAVTVVAGAAVATGSAKAQTGANVRHSNPSGMVQPTAYSQVVEVNGPHRLVFVAGQTGVDASGKAAKEFRAQAIQSFENIKTALASAGGSMDNVVRLVTYLTDIEQNADAYRDVPPHPMAKLTTKSGVRSSSWHGIPMSRPFCWRTAVRSLNCPGS